MNDFELAELRAELNALQIKVNTLTKRQRQLHDIIRELGVWIKRSFNLRREASSAPGRATHLRSIPRSFERQL